MLTSASKLASSPLGAGSDLLLQGKQPQRRPDALRLLVGLGAPDPRPTAIRWRSRYGLSRVSAVGGG